MDNITNGKEEMLTIIVLGAIVIAALVVLGADGKDVALAVGTGLIGFLKGAAK
jgi:hypothetical protein